MHFVRAALLKNENYMYRKLDKIMVKSRRGEDHDK